MKENIFTIKTIDEGLLKGRNNSSLILLLVAGVIFAAGVAVKLSAPLVEWDYLSILQAASWAKDGKFFVPDHPPLYPYLLSFFSGSPGAVAVFRCLNLAAVGLTSFLLYAFSRKYLERALSLTVVSLYLLTPAVIQGVSILDYADTSWLPLAFLLFVKLAAAMRGRFSIYGFLALTAAAILCLGFKVTSSAALFISFLLYWLAEGKEVKKYFLPVLTAIAAGALLFALGWKAAAPHLFSGEVTQSLYVIAKNTVLSRIFSAFSLENAGKWLVYLVVMVLWFSPFLISLWLAPVLKRGGYQEAAAPADIRCFSFVSAFYFIGYFFVGGLNHGFPRYQMAVWPVIVFLAVYGSRGTLRGILERDVAKTAAAVCLAVLPGVLFLPDPLYLLNMGLKEAIISGHGMRAVAAGLTGVCCFYLGFVWVLSRRAGSSLLNSLVAAGMAFYLITDLSQLKAGYLTSYEYGTAGKAELAADLRASVPAAESIFATPGLLYYFRQERRPEYGTSDWSSAGSIEAVVTGRLPEVVVMSEGSNMLWQFRLFQSELRLAAFLRDNYVPKKTGTFLVWRKKTLLEKK